MGPIDIQTPAYRCIDIYIYIILHLLILRAVAHTCTYTPHDRIVGMQQLWDELPCATWRGCGTRSTGTFASNSAGATVGKNDCS